LNAREYYLALQAAIHAAPHVLHSALSFEEIDPHECYLRGVLRLIGDLELHVAEYVVTAHLNGSPYARRCDDGAARLLRRRAVRAAPTFHGLRMFVSDVLERVTEGLAWETIIEE
jgi:hypothetical protein